MRFRPLFAVAMGVLALGLASLAAGKTPPSGVLEPPATALGVMPQAAPFVIVQAGDTTWVQVHTNDARCPGDPLGGHGGEGTGGPTSSETWCFEGGVGDTCGTVPPWNTNCFKYIDLMTWPSWWDGTNYWHVDTYRTDQRSYTGTRCLWCGSSGYWPPGQTETLVGCGTWATPPGYGTWWVCYVQLQLPPSFSTAGGCTLYFDPRYDTECKQDTFHVDYWNGTAWTNLANFNATSNNPGSACSGLPPPFPDYFGNVDTNRLVNCDWQERTDPGKPAFKAIIPSGSLPGNSPKFRWRFDSDGGWDDLDGVMIDTDGAAYIDNVWVFGDLGNRYRQDFEASPIGQDFPQYWSLLPTPGVAQGWHLKHDADPPYEGGDAGSRTTCLLDSSWAFRARPEQGYPPGSPRRVGFNYGLMSPRVRIANTGAVVQYDMFACVTDPTCDYVNTLVRFYDNVNHT